MFDFIESTLFDSCGISVLFLEPPGNVVFLDMSYIMNNIIVMNTAAKTRNIFFDLDIFSF